MSKRPRHQEIFSELKAEILAGTYDSAKRLTSEAQLVGRFGVCRPTVARALQELDRDRCVFSQRSTYDLVGMDHIAAVYLLAEHLIKLGVRRIEFVSRPLSASTVDERQAGAAMMAHRVAISKEFHQQGNCMEVDFVRKLTDGKRLDAVICDKDHTAAQLL